MKIVSGNDNGLVENFQSILLKVSLTFRSCGNYLETHLQFDNFKCLSVHYTIALEPHKRKNKLSRSKTCNFIHVIMNGTTSKHWCEEMKWEFLPSRALPRFGDSPCFLFRIKIHIWRYLRIRKVLVKWRKVNTKCTVTKITRTLAIPEQMSLLYMIFPRLVLIWTVGLLQRSRRRCCIFRSA